VPHVSRLKRGIKIAEVPGSLIHSQESGDLHLVTFSCSRRRQHLGPSAARELFERSLETMQLRYDPL